MKKWMIATACMVLMVSGGVEAARRKKGAKRAPAPGPAVLYDTVAPAQLGETAPSLVQGDWKKVDGAAAVSGDAA